VNFGPEGSPLKATNRLKLSSTFQSQSPSISYFCFIFYFK